VKAILSFIVIAYLSSAALKASVTENLSVLSPTIPSGADETFNVMASCTTNDLSSFSFYIEGPGENTFTYIGNVGASNPTNGSGSLSWTTPAPGTYTVACQAWIASNSQVGATVYQTFVVSAAAPVTAHLSVSSPSVPSGTAETFNATASCTTNNLSSFSFYIEVAGSNTWTYIGNVGASNPTNGAGSLSWTTPAPGTYTVACQAWVANNSQLAATVYQTFVVSAALPSPTISATVSQVPAYGLPGHNDIISVSAHDAVGIQSLTINANSPTGPLLGGGAISNTVDASAVANLYIGTGVIFNIYITAVDSQGRSTTYMTVAN